ncbi:hypothetical protein EZS27_025300, partial [termite gut metagenome]
GTITGKNEEVGGITGFLVDRFHRKNDMLDTFANCYNTGTVKGNDMVGGLVGSVELRGYNDRGSFFANCYSSGKLISNFPFVTDGLVGYYYTYRIIRETDVSDPKNGYTQKEKLLSGSYNDVSLNTDASVEEASAEGEEGAFQFVDLPVFKGDVSIDDMSDYSTYTYLLIERYGDECYRSESSCLTTVLPMPRFYRFLGSAKWNQLTPLENRSPKNMKKTPDEYMQSMDFVTVLNTWVDKNTQQKRSKPFSYKRWKKDEDGINQGYPIFE